jgi:CTP synthase
MIVARSDTPVDVSVCEKIAQFCDVEPRAVIPMVTAPILYEIPLLLENANVGSLLIEKLNLTDPKKANWKPWEQLVEETKKEKPTVTIALVGKYVELHDAYISVREALKHAALSLGIEIDLKWVHSVDLEKGDLHQPLTGLHGILVPGGFGSRGIEGKINAIRFARQNSIPYFGLCLGMQLQVVEFSRDVLHDERANSAEFDSATPHPVIDLMPEQKDITNLGGTMRLGLYPCQLIPGSIAHKAYNTDSVQERHRHRFELNNQYRQQLESNGLLCSGISPDGKLVEIVELKGHPFMLGTQFHPEFLSRPTRPHPLFVQFLQAACSQAGVMFQNPPLRFEP